jgi:hypothetical protein
MTLYDADSYLYSRADQFAVDSVRTAAFHKFMATHPDQKAIKYPKLNGIVATNMWGTTYHESSASDPIWRATGASVRDRTLILGKQGLHIADSVFRRVPTGTQDRPTLIVDKSFGYTAFMADVVPNYTARTFAVSSCGVTWHGSNGLDYRNSKANDPRNVASRGRLHDALVISATAIKAAAAAGTGLGIVPQIFFVETLSSDGHKHPMVGEEGKKFGWGAEGERLAIRGDVDLVAKGFKGEALALARTCQDSGIYIGDNSGSSSQLKGEQASKTYLPYAGTNITPTCLSPLAWTDWVVLK